MGQKTSPIGFRTGITRDWQSTWYASKGDYGKFLVEDQKIRQYIENKYNRQMPKGAVAKIEIVRTRNEVKVTLYSARPGVVIGPRGGGTPINQIIAIKKIAKHINYNLSDEEINNVSTNLFGNTATFREGKIGSWRKYFSKANVHLVKKIFGKLLIKLGYEKDFYWNI